MVTGLLDRVMDTSEGYPGYITSSVQMGRGDGSFSGSIVALSYQLTIPHRNFSYVDINGDNLPDRVQLGNSVGVWFNKGNGQFGDRNEGSISAPASSHLNFADINNDGINDIIFDGGYSSPEFHVFQGDGMGNFNCSISQSIPLSYRSNWISYIDINNDNIPDRIAEKRTTSSSYNVYTWLGKSQNRNKLVSIQTPSHAKIRFEYGHSFDTQDNQIPFHLEIAKKITRDDGNGVVAVTEYDYKNGLFDRKTRELRGFGRIIETNPDGTVLEWMYRQGEFDKGRVFRKNFRESASGDILSQTTNTWQTEYLTPGNDVAFVSLQQTRTNHYDGPTVFIQEDRTFDNTNGNLMSAQFSGTNAETVTYYYNYANYGVWLWCKTLESVTGVTSGLVRKTGYDYEIGTGNRITQTLVLDGVNDPVTVTAFDTYGNSIQVQDPMGNSTQTFYDTDTHAFPVETHMPQTNGVAHISKVLELDYGTGKPLLTEDENGNRTAYTYDTFGRPVRADMPEGRQILTQYNDTASPRSVVSKVKADASGNFIQTTTFLDGFNRTVQTVAPGENSQYLITRTHYDDMGRPVSRDTQSSEHAVITTTYEYTGLSTRIIDPDGVARTQTRDYLDRITRVVEHGDAGDFTTDYAYNGAGDLTRITDHNANPTVTTYDLLGRKTRMADPDMGVWQYTYDANGNLLTRTDAENQTLTHAYDALNRVTLKTFSTGDPDVVYTYDDPSVSNGRGLLYQVSDGDVTTTVNGYTAFGDILSETRTIAGAPQSYTTQYTYDLSGKPLTTTHPDGLTLTRTFFAGTNLLEQVTGSDGTVYARLSNYTPQGKIGRIAYPNATHTDYTYDDWSGRLTTIRTTGPAGTLLDRTYTYTPAGDISSIADGVAGVTYEYAYDRLHRLISETGAGSDRFFSYDALGNIITKTHGPDTLAYTYAGPAPHAVTQIDINGSSYPLSYDANGNMVSGPDLTDRHLQRCQHAPVR